MAKTKIEGSLFVRKSCDKIYFKYRGKQYSTGCSNTKEGWKQAKEYQLDFIKGGYYSDDILDCPSAILEYGKHLQAKNLAGSTIVYYLKFLKKAMEFVWDRGVDEELLISVSRRLQENGGKCHSTRRINRTMFLSFCKFLSKKITIDLNKVRYDLPINKEKKEIRIYEDKEIKMVIDAMRSGEYNLPREKNGETIKRQELILLFMLFTGSRAAETISLKWEQIDLDDGVVTFVNKIKKSQYDTVPLSEAALNILNQAREMQISEIYVFKKDKVKAKTEYHNFYSRLKLITQKLGLFNSGKSSHALRRAFLTKLIKSDAPLKAVKELARHSDINITLALYNKYEPKSNKRYADAVGEISPFISPNIGQKPTKTAETS